MILPILALGALVFIVVFIILFIVSLPVYLAVKILGGNTTILKTMAVVVGSTILGMIISFFIDTTLQAPLVSIILGFLVTISIYKFAFTLSWLKAFGAWLLSIILTIILVFIILGGAILTAVFLLPL